LRGRVDYSVLNCQATTEKQLGTVAAVGGTLYGNWFTASDAGYQSGIGGTVFGRFTQPRQALSAYTLFQWETDRRADGTDTTWVRAEARANYSSGQSRIDLIYYLWAVNSTPRHYLLVSYSRWFDFVDPAPRR
jgi:hypothetical protein